MATRFLHLLHTVLSYRPHAAKKKKKKGRREKLHLGVIISFRLFMRLFDEADCTHAD